MDSHLKNYAVVYVVFAASLALSVYSFLFLPETLIVQWGIDNQPSNYMPKNMFALGYPAFAFFMTWLIVFLMNKSLNEHDDKQSKSVITYVAAITGFISISSQLWIVLANATDIQLTPAIFVSYLFAGILILLGNIMGKIKPNKYVGFRVSWTMNSEENWRATHRFGGKAMMLAGLMMFIGTFVSDNNIWVISNIVLWWLLGLFAPLVYSYTLHKVYSDK